MPSDFNKLALQPGAHGGKMGAQVIKTKIQIITTSISTTFHSMATHLQWVVAHIGDYCYLALQ